MKRSPLQRKTPLRSSPFPSRPVTRRTPLDHQEPHPGLQRKAHLKRTELRPGTKPPRSKKPVNPVNRARKAANFARAYGSEDRVEWVQSLPCCVCGRSPSQNAHIRTGGMGRKSDARFIVPLCAKDHAEQEGRTAAFERDRRLPAGFLERAAADLEALWQARLARS